MEKGSYCFITRFLTRNWKEITKFPFHNIISFRACIKRVGNLSLPPLLFFFFFLVFALDIIIKCRAPTKDNLHHSFICKVFFSGLIVWPIKCQEKKAVSLKPKVKSANCLCCLTSRQKTWRQSQRRGSKIITSETTGRGTIWRFCSKNALIGDQIGFCCQAVN